MTFISETLFLFLTVAGLFFVPGYLMLHFLFTKQEFSSFEAFLLSFALGTGIMDFLMIFLGKNGVHFSLVALSLGIFGVLILVGVLGFFGRRFSKQKRSSLTPASLFSFSQKQVWLFLLLLSLTLIIKTTYLSHTVLPTATDMGHHMYWSKLIAEKGELPFYGKIEIENTENGDYELSDDPKAIADFIIGEHLPFAALNIFSHVDFFTAFPVVFLFLINILSLLALLTLAARLTEDIIPFFPHSSLFTKENIALAVLFLFGPLYSLASPQAKFVSGGVVGNTFGNLFIPLILLIFYRAFREKKPTLLSLGFFLTFTLAYTHHLSTFILLFVLIFSALLYLAIHFNDIGTELRSWFALFIHPLSLITIFALFSFFFLVAMPTYIETHAVSTAVGTPTKSTRTGLSFSQITSSSGEVRVALGLAALFLLSLFRSRVSYAATFLLGWGIILLVMTLAPNWLFVDIPSNRIGAYLSFPLGMLAAFAIVGLAAFLKEKTQSFFLPAIGILFVAFTLFTFATGSGSFDNSQTLVPEAKGFAAVETFNASTYLAQRVTQGDIVLKDHNYIAADSWMKLFFLRDYAFPLSRGYFKRYEDNPNREQCTLLMISVPNTPKGEKCYTETGTNYVVINPHVDATQFEKSGKFSRVYSSSEIHIYLRNK